jgi:hypothetical protein
MKKIFARFLVLITLCMCLGALSTIGFAGNDDARVPRCEKPQCVDYGVTCWSSWNPRSRTCEMFCTYDPNCLG